MKIKHRETLQIVERLGKFTRDFRTQIRSRALSQATLARRSGYSRVTLSSIERASGHEHAPNPHLDVLVGIAKGFGVRPSDFLALAEADTYPLPRETIGRVAEALGVSEDVIDRSVNRVDRSFNSNGNQTSDGGDGVPLALALRESPRLDSDSDQPRHRAPLGGEQARLRGSITEIGAIVFELARFMGDTSERILSAVSAATQQDDEVEDTIQEGGDESHAT